MPIYKQINNEETVINSQPIEWHDTEYRLAKEAICVHFGYGDVVMNAGRSRNAEYADELCFRPALGPQPIGTKEGADYDKRPIFAPVRFIFDKRESIDAVIAELEGLKTTYPISQPAQIDYPALRKQIAAEVGYVDGMEMSAEFVEKTIAAEIAVCRPLGLIDENGQQSFETAIMLDLSMSDEQRQNLLSLKD